MFRGFIYRTRSYRQGIAQAPLAGSGNLNVTDGKNYISAFTLQADTGQAFTLNGSSAITSCYINDEGYYEAGMYDITGSYYVRRFCFVSDMVNNPISIQVVSQNKYYSKLNNYLDVKGNKENSMNMYSERPLMVTVKDDVEMTGLVWTPTFHKEFSDNNIKIIAGRKLYVYDESGNELYYRTLTV